MAIYHLSAKTISRSDNRTAVAAAAYRAGARLTNERDGKVHDYSRRHGVAHAEIIAPAHAPEWVYDRSKLWNKVELSEKRINSRVAREIVVALPCDLEDPEDRKKLVVDFTKRSFVGRGMIADVAIHEPDRKGDQRNYHAHILLTTREINPLLNDFGAKRRDWNDRNLLVEWRHEWENAVNRALEEREINERVSASSFQDRGIDRVPTKHIGLAATQLERKGIVTERGDLHRAILDFNANLDRQEAEINFLESELADETERFLEQQEKVDELEEELKRFEIGKAWALQWTEQFLKKLEAEKAQRQAQLKAERQRNGRIAAVRTGLSDVENEIEQYDIYSATTDRETAETDRRIGNTDRTIEVSQSAVKNSQSAIARAIAKAQARAEAQRQAHLQAERQRKKEQPLFADRADAEMWVYAYDKYINLLKDKKSIESRTADYYVIEDRDFAAWNHQIKEIELMIYRYNGYIEAVEPEAKGLFGNRESKQLIKGYREEIGKKQSDIAKLKNDIAKRKQYYTDNLTMLNSKASEHITSEIKKARKELLSYGIHNDNEFRHRVNQALDYLDLNKNITQSPENSSISRGQNRVDREIDDDLER